jgi:hypothetical protein
MTLRSVSVRREDEPLSDRYWRNDKSQRPCTDIQRYYLVSFIKHWEPKVRDSRNDTGGDLPTSFAGEPVRASIKRPRIISKKEHAEDASMNGDDKLTLHQILKAI